MTTWLKKLRLYLLRRDLRRVIDNMRAFHPRGNPYVWVLHCDQRADLIDRIAEIEKSL